MKELFYSVFLFELSLSCADYAQNVDLRYGFHKTEDCQNFEKAFLCVRKCLDLKFDVAYADKNCDCTCYKKPDKAKYTTLSFGMQKYKYGAPTTIVPPWIQKLLATSEEPEITAEEANKDNLPCKQPTSTIHDIKQAKENGTDAYAKPGETTLQVTEHFNEAKTVESNLDNNGPNTHETVARVSEDVSKTEALVTQANE